MQTPVVPGSSVKRETAGRLLEEGVTDVLKGTDRLPGAEWTRMEEGKACWETGAGSGSSGAGAGERCCPPAHSGQRLREAAAGVGWHLKAETNLWVSEMQNVRQERGRVTRVSGLIK